MQQIRKVCGLIVGLCLLCAASGRVCGAVGYNFQEYHGNGSTDGTVVSKGTLQLSNNLYTVRANFINGGGSFVENLVVYIDCAPGGFTSTAPFSENSTALERSVTGNGTPSRSTANFAPGFEADYAIALGVNSGSAIYKLVNDATGPHLELVTTSLSFGPTDNPNRGSFSFQFDWAYIGLPNRETNFFKFESTYIMSTGFRTLESFEGLTGTRGFGSVTFTNYDTYGVPPVPENTNVALIVFGGLVLTVGAGKRFRKFLSR
jgi:hypothetical protein